MKRKIAAMMAALAAVFTASAETCITDVMVVGGENKSVTNSYAAQGWTVIKQDLNAGAGGDYVFLLYKSADSAIVSNGFITGFYIKTGAVTNELTHEGRVYSLAPCAGDADFVNGKGDLNSKTTKPGDNIHLYCTKSVFPDNRAVTGITFNSDQNGAIGKNGGTTGYDLNSHAEGDFIYMHASTAAVPYAPGVSYLDPTDPAHPEKLCTDFTVITDQTELTGGWYVVAGAITNDIPIYVSGDVNLILTDGAELAANSGIIVERNDSLTIWAQGTNAVAGKLTARGDDAQAGIGGINYRPGGVVTVNGGTVEAHGGQYGAGIGGGWESAGGVVTVNGGTVEAHGGTNAAGIGGGNYGGGGVVTVNGGMVEANGGVNAAGIGGGCGGGGGAVTVNGGMVTAKGDTSAAGIGGGYDGGDDGLLSITGMKVGYVGSDGEVHEWAAPGDRDGYCRNREEKTVRIEVCLPHVFEGEFCKICGEKALYLDPTDPVHPEKLCTDFTVITDQTTLTGGWYVVAGAVTIGSRITVSGDVNLILMDRAELAANSGITVEEGNSLTIWAQSTNAIAGKLTAHGGQYAAGIGGGYEGTGGAVTVNGGTVDAHGGGTGAGIGGGWQGDGGAVTVNGGSVEAHGGMCAAGIGGGNQGTGGEVTVNGGTVDAHGGECGAGIGGGFGRAGGEMTVNGGTVEAHGGEYGAGIGGGSYGWWGGILTVNGGTVEAHGGSGGGAGIGGGELGGGGEVTFTGGSDEAKGGGGAAIGAGVDATNHGSLSILLGMAVYDADTSETPVAFGEREAVCRGSWAKVTPCRCADEAHGLCRYCGFGSLVAGEYFKATLAEMGYDVPTDGTPYSVKAYGLPAGLKLKYNAAVTKKVKKGKKTVTVVVKPAKSEWWIEGVPTAALDYETNPPYLAVTVGGKTELVPVCLDVFAQDVTELGTFPVGTAWNAESPLYLPGVTNGWTVSGLPSGLKYTPKLVTKANKKGKKVVSVTTNALPYSVYGKTTAAGLFTVTATKKKGAYYEAMKYRMLVTPKEVTDTALFGDDLTNITTMAYVPVDWNLMEGGSAGGLALPVVSNVAKVAGLPAGVTFAAKNTYAYANPKKKTGKYLKQYGQTIVGTPTKPGTYVVTFTKNVTTGTGKNKKTVAKTAQILWKVVPNDAELSLGFNASGGVVEGGSVGLKYGDLLAFSATSNATVTASGLPAGMKLVRLDGSAGGLAPPGEAAWGFGGFTTKAGTYLVTVTATLNGKTVRQRLLLEVEGLPAWAKGTFNGSVKCKMENGELGEDALGLATITVSSVGKISGKFYEGGTNWVLSAASYTGAARPEASPHQGGSRSVATETFTCSNVVAKYTYKAKEKVNGKWNTVTKSVTRTFALTVTPVPVVPDVSEVPVRGFAALVEAARSASGPYQGAEIDAWQNLWGSTYKAVGKKLFYTSKKKPFKTFAVDVYANDAGAVTFIRKGVDDVDKTGLTCFAALSLKVTPSGVVTATLSYDTGKTKKDPETKKTVKVIYKPTCATVVIPTSSPDADPFTGEAPLYFAPSTGNNFPGFAASVLF